MADVGVTADRTVMLHKGQLTGQRRGATWWRRVPGAPLPRGAGWVARCLVLIDPRGRILLQGER